MCNIIGHFECDKRHGFRFVLLLKIVLRCLDWILWGDTSQVWEITTVKLYLNWSGMVYSHVEVRICFWFPASRPWTSRTCTFSHCVVVWRIVQYLFYLLYYVIAPIRNTKSLPLVSSRLSPLISNTASWCLLYLSGFGRHWPLHCWMDEICQEAYRKIPKISPSKYKPPKPVTQKKTFR